MPVPTRAAATPMAIAQPNCATSGTGTAGRSGIASESVPSPVHCAEADEDERADAGREEAGHEHHAHHRPRDAAHLHEQEGADHGRAEQRADRGEGAGGADHGHRLLPGFRGG